MAFFHHMAVPWEKVPHALLLDLDATGSFNGPLWSINVEAVASMIFPLLVLAGRSGGLAGRIALLVLFVPAGRYIDVRAVFFLFCFQLGIMVRDFVPLVRRLPPRVTHALLGVSVLAIIIPSNVTRLGFLSAAMSMRIEALGALYLICCLVSGAAPGVTAWLRRAPLVFLGRISFSVYALHYPILGSLAF